MTNADTKRYVKTDRGIIDTQQHPKILRVQEEEERRRFGARPKVTTIAKAVADEKAALNEAKGVIHGQVK